MIKDKWFSNPHYWICCHLQKVSLQVDSVAPEIRNDHCVDTLCLLRLGSFLSNYGRLYLELPDYLWVLPRVATTDVIGHNLKNVYMPL